MYDLLVMLRRLKFSRSFILSICIKAVLNGNSRVIVLERGTLFFIDNEVFFLPVEENEWDF